VSVSVSPFAPLEGSSNFVETHFYLLSSVDLYMPVEIRADILMGVASLAARLIPSAKFTLDTHIGSVDKTMLADLFIEAKFILKFEVEACLFSAFCYTFGPYTLLEENLIDPQGTDFRSDINKCSGGGGLEEAGEPARDLLGAGGQDLGTFTKCAPVTVISPDGGVAIDCWFEDDGTARVQVNRSPTSIPSFPWNPKVFEVRDPAAAFVSNDGALLAWTASSPNLAPGYPFPEPAGVAEEVAQTNAMMAQEDIAISPLVSSNGWTIGTAYLVTDGMATSPADRRADGKAAIAADLAAGEALVAWVRYETADFLIIDGVKTLRSRWRTPPGRSASS